MANLEYYKDPPPDIVQMAVCPGCGQEKPLTNDFYVFGMCAECLWLECDLLDDPRQDNPTQPCLMNSAPLKNVGYGDDYLLVRFVGAL